MTVHTIPADHLDAARGGVLVVDGEACPRCTPPDFYAVHKPTFHAPAWALALLRPCETCDGTGSMNNPTKGGMIDMTCLACGGSGRPILTVSWLRLCVDEFPDRCPDLKYCDGLYRSSFRAHVLNVVPIRGTGESRFAPLDPCVKIYDLGDDDAPALVHNVYQEPTPITLPPGEHVGRYAVLIEPEES